MHKGRIITLLSDFGVKDPYVAEMKAVILSICPNVTIVDISHEVREFDVRMGAFILAQAAPFFPEGTIHVAVVDPGVGTKRRPIIVQTESSLYVGPDNGLLLLSARKTKISHIYQITNREYMLQNVSRTFHGRDVFSPAAAHLAKGVSPWEFGPEISDPLTPSFTEAVVRKGEVQGEVIHVNGFGNLVTNITSKDLEDIGVAEGKNLLLRLGSKDLTLRLCTAYGEVPPNTPLCIIGSSAFLEVAVNQGDASQALGTMSGEKVTIRGLAPTISDRPQHARLRRDNSCYRTEGDRDV